MKTVSVPAVMVPAMTSADPRHNTTAVHAATTTATMGDTTDFTRRALRAASTACCPAIAS